LHNESGQRGTITPSSGNNLYISCILSLLIFTIKYPIPELSISILLSSVLLFSPDEGTFSGDSVHEKRERIRDKIRIKSIIFFIYVLLSWVFIFYVVTD